MSTFTSIFTGIGLVISVGVGIAVTGLLINAATQYAWGKMKDAYGLARLHRAIRLMADDDAEAR